jgi:hypothetical protein
MVAGDGGGILQTLVHVLFRKVSILGRPGTKEERRKNKSKLSILGRAG